MPLAKTLIPTSKLASIKSTFSAEEKLWLYQGMVLTRAVDNMLKKLFLSGEITYEGKGFSGKGFRSLGQEAIYGAALRLKKGLAYQKDGAYLGDVAAPLIRDLGIFLAFSDNNISQALNAQAAKSGGPSDGRDLHLGDLSCGLIFAAAPLAISTCTIIGHALAFKRSGSDRVALSFIGEGGSSLGEWHEAINFASVKRLPMIFCIENNQQALSTKTTEQCRALSFASKASGYGIIGFSIDGNDVEEVAASFKWAADEARGGNGPILIELLTMRMCGHAHHDDMIYLGYDPPLDFSLPKAKANGYVDHEKYQIYQTRDPIKLYEQKLIDACILSVQKADEIKKTTQKKVQSVLEEIKQRPWPKFSACDEELVFSAPWVFVKKSVKQKVTKNFSAAGQNYLQAIALGIKRSFIKHHGALVIGEDVAPPYGNAFMMFKDFDKKFHDRFINTPISENAIVGACVGMAMCGLRPIGEIQFNDFVACAMNQVANNAAKSYFRLGQNLPLVLRLPYGGLRRAGPYHSQDSSAWFYRTPGLKIMAPSSPLDAMHMMMMAVDDPDPVLFYEHIALYRDPSIKQMLDTSIETSLLEASLLSLGQDLTIISYGAYVHKICRVARMIENMHNKSIEVIDLRYLKPIDYETCFASIKKTSKVLLCTEDARTGSILEAFACVIADELFHYLDAPVKVLGSRDIPVPYAPSLEDGYLLSEEMIAKTAVDLINY